MQSSEQPEMLEFAELICGRMPYVESDGTITTLFTIQFRAFSTTPDGPEAPLSLPVVCIRPEQAVHLPDALRTGLERWLPEEMKRHAESAVAQPGQAPTRLN